MGSQVLEKSSNFLNVKIMSELTKEYLIESGVHFGHPTQKWNPAFKKFIAGQKNGIHIIDVNNIQNMHKPVTELVKASNGGNILFVELKNKLKKSSEGADNCGRFMSMKDGLEEH